MPFLPPWVGQPLSVTIVILPPAASETVWVGVSRFSVDAGGEGGAGLDGLGRANHNHLKNRKRTLLRPFLHKVASGMRKRVTVEEGMTIDGAEIRGLAQRRVVLHGYHGVHSDHRPTVAGAFESSASGTNGSGDLLSRSTTVIDKFIADANGADHSPIAVDSGGHSLHCLRDGFDIEYAEEELGFSLCCGHHVRHLVAIYAVETDDFEVIGLL